MAKENEIKDYQCPKCQKNDISFKEMKASLNPPDKSLTHQMLSFFCYNCQKEFKVEAGVIMYQVSLINILKKKYP
jgi:DNA-directed RNA polymerase subunit RPC12/RpoP